MEKKKGILLSSLVIFLILISFSFGIFLGEKRAEKLIQIAQQKELQKAKLIEKRYFNITGIVNEKVDHALILSANGETMTIPIAEDAKVDGYVLIKERVERQESTFEDIDIGEKVSVFTEEKENGEFIGTSVYIHFVPQNP